MTAIHGLVPPVLSPLDENGDLDRASLERLVTRLLEGGVDGIFALGSSGETVYLSDGDRDTALEIIVGTVSGAVPVVAGAIEPTTPRVIDRIAAAQRLGADAVVATAPFYTIVGEAEIDRHFRTLAQFSSLPLLAYDIPVCVHRKLSNAMLLDLAAEGLLAGLKDSSGDDVAFRQLLLSLTDRGAAPFSALTGHEVMVDAMLAAGANGSVPGLANVDPHGYARLHAAAARGDWAQARVEQDRLIRLFRIVEAADPDAAGTTRGVGAFKTALWLLGTFTSNAISLPSRPLRGEEVARIRRVLEETGLL